MPSYEELLTDITAVPASTTGGVRDIKWATPAEVVGVAQDHTGRLELFLADAELQASSRTVRDSLEHHEWFRKAGVPLNANRLLLPALGHFDAVAAFICTELLRNGADQDIKHAFQATEPIIELAIKRLLISEAALLGLAGELLLLSSMCHQADPHQVASVIQAWDGWRRSSRDFHWDGTGVELKTTMRSTSTHTVEGVHQIEPTEGESGTSAEDRLLLASMFHGAGERGGSASLPVLSC